MATNLHSHNAKQQLINALTTAAKADAELAQILSKYTNGQLSIQDATIKTIQQGNAVSELSLFNPVDEKRDGIYSLSKAMLDKDVVFFVIGMSVLTYQATTTSGGNTVPATLNPKSTDEYAAMLNADNYVNIGSAASYAMIANGDFSVRINRKPVISQLSNQVFNNLIGPTNAPSTLGQNGFYKLENPFLVKPQVSIEMDLRLPVPTLQSTLIETTWYGVQTLAV